MVMYIILLALLPSLLIAQDCGDTEHLVKDKMFNFNHLKNHLPPSQTYQKPTNLYAKDNKKFVFFNILDVVHKGKIDSHSIDENCSPRSLLPEQTTNRPAVCRLEEDKSKCPEPKTPCWVAMGSCKNVTVSAINEDKLEEGVKILYQGGDKIDEKTDVSLTNVLKKNPSVSSNNMFESFTLYSHNKHLKQVSVIIKLFIIV